LEREIFAMRMSTHLVIVAIAVIGLQLAGCQRESSTYTKVPPAKVEKMDGAAHSRLTLTEKAMERIGVKTVPVQEFRPQGAVDAKAQPAVPYSAVVYEPMGGTLIYTSPAPRTFVRAPVEVESIQGDVAVLKNGPAAGTEVVTVGAAELFGTELGVGQ
jgi:hypothetical protein